MKHHVQIEGAKVENDSSIAEQVGTFRTDRYHEELQTSKYGKVMLSTRVLASTQALLLQNRKAMPSGAC